MGLSVLDEMSDNRCLHEDDGRPGVSVDTLEAAPVYVCRLTLPELLRRNEVVSTVGCPGRMELICPSSVEGGTGSWDGVSRS